jgi:hypothetical protein
LQQVNTGEDHSPTTQNLTAQPKKRFSYFFEKILSAKGGYFSKKLYSLKHTDDESFELKTISANENPNLYWLILGREHYFETSKDYPIANKRDLKKALKFEDNSSPFQGETLRYIERINESSHRVTFWVIDPDVFIHLSFRPWLVIPESHVIANGLKGRFTLATVDCIDKSLFIAETGLGVFSGVKSQRINTVEHFALSTGSPLNHDNLARLHFKPTQFCALLHQGMQALTLEHLSGFILAKKRTDWQSYPWKQAGVIVVATFSLYMVLTSLWLVYNEYQLEQQLTEQAFDVDRAFLLQKQYKNQKRLQNILTEPLKTQIPYWNIWPIILESIDSGASITAIHYKNEKIIMHGSTKQTIKATDILAKLSDNKNIKSPSFSKPVRNYRGREQFAISFTLSKSDQHIDNTSAINDFVEGESHATSK